MLFHCALACTVLIDQIMYTHFRKDYSKFQQMTRYPKIEAGITGINVNPWLITHSGIGLTTLEKFIEFFVVDLKEFFTERLSPKEIIKSLSIYIKWKIYRLTGDNETAYVTDPKFYATQCFAKSLKYVWGKEPVYQREGGSIPIASHLQNILGINSILSGFGLPDDHIHSPNERLDLDVFWMGIKAIIHFLFNITEDRK